MTKLNHRRTDTLTLEELTDIRDRLDAGDSLRGIARDYNIMDSVLRRFLLTLGQKHSFHISGFRIDNAIGWLDHHIQQRLQNRIQISA